MSAPMKPVRLPYSATSTARGPRSGGTAWRFDKRVTRVSVRGGRSQRSGTGGRLDSNGVSRDQRRLRIGRPRFAGDRPSSSNARQGSVSVVTIPTSLSSRTVSPDVAMAAPPETRALAGSSVICGSASVPADADKGIDQPAYAEPQAPARPVTKGEVDALGGEVDRAFGRGVDLVGPNDQARRPAHHAVAGLQEGRRSTPPGCGAPAGCKG